MRYSADRSHTFGIMIDRDVYRYNERYIWPLLRQSKTGFVSQFGALHGVDDLEGVSGALGGDLHGARLPVRREHPPARASSG